MSRYKYNLFIMNGYYSQLIFLRGQFIKYEIRTKDCEKIHNWRDEQDETEKR